MSKSPPFGQTPDPLQLFERALGHHKSGRLTEAERVYRELLAAKPDHVEGRHLLGVLRSQQGHVAEALELVSGALTIKPDWPAALLTQGNILGRTGRYVEALASFDKALALKPDYAEALNNRGNLLSALMRHNEALESYERALAIKPDYAEALNNRGTSLEDLRRYDEALQSYDRALALRPNYIEALNNRGGAFNKLERYEDAIASFRQALTLRPDYIEALNNLGNTLALLKRHDEALASYDKALSIWPGYAQALYNRGNLLSELGRPDDALASYDRALAAAPNYAEALNNRAGLLLERGRHAEALAGYDAVLAVAPNYLEAINGRGNALQLLGHYQEALASHERALTLKPDDVDALFGRGRAAQQLDRHEEAVASFDQALAQKPDHIEALYARGYSLRVMNHWRAAIDCYDKVLALEPKHARARLAVCMAQLPILYADEAEISERRIAYAQRLQALCDEVEKEKSASDLADAVGSSQPFYLGYQARNDRDLQRLYGSLICRVMAERFPPVALAKPPAPDEPVRVGIVSGYFWWHSVWKIPLHGWLNLDRQRFRVFCYHTGGRQDGATEMARGLCDRFVQGPLLIDEWRHAIAADAPHVLLYPDIGMDPVSAALAAQRLAPAQCMSLGHPDTSGFPTLDYFLTSDFMEPADGADHYTEQLIRLPNLSVYYEPVESPPAQIDRAALGLRADTTVFWCGQSLYKYLPQFDEVFARIARDVGDCQFAFIRYPKGTAVTELFQARLERAFAAVGLKAADYCVFLPRLDQTQFVAAIGQCDIILDSIGWSGFNSTMESLAHGLPIVTMTGALMRGGHTTGVLKTIGVTETITTTVGDYVATAVRLAKDLAWRAAVKQRMAANSHRAYRDRACVEALEDFIDRVARIQPGNISASSRP
jgi:tetratricopeptide (TPR) repeat protein